MFKRWFKRRQDPLRSPDAQQRLEALTQLEETGPDTAAVIAEMAKSDPDLRVRQASTARLTDQVLLGELLEDPAVAETCAKRLAHLAEQTNTPLDPALAAHPLLRQHRVTSLSQATPEAALEALQNEEDAALLAIRARGATRDVVLESPWLRSESGLVLLEKLSRGKDKTCNRHARDQLEILKNHREACRQTSARLEEIDDSIQRELRNTPADADGLIAQRSKLRIIAQNREEVCSTLESTLHTLAQWQCEEANQTIPVSPLDGVDLYVPEPGDDAYAGLVQALEAFEQQLASATDPELMTTQRDRLAQAWLSAADKFPPRKEQQQVFERASNVYQAWSAAWSRYDAQMWTQAAAAEPDRDWQRHWTQQLKELRWPNSLPEPPPVTQVKAQLEAQKVANDDAKARQKQSRQALDELLQQAEQHIEQGQTREAATALREARKLIQNDSLPASDKRLGALSARLAELQDWQNFATDPKRETLLAQVKEIADTPLAPNRQAERLKQLRQEWRDLGPVKSAADREQQQSFDTYAETAYEPCKAFFDQQNAERAANLTARVAICEQLEAYLQATDWQQTDLKAAENIMRTARDTWRSHHPCDRKSLKPVQDRFEALQDQLHTHIKAGWDRNAEAKRELVSKAQKLLDSDQALPDAIEQAKQLQQDWRHVGPVPRSIDQKLWRDFRQACDALFARREDAFAARKSEQQALAQALEQAVVAVEQAASGEPANFRDAQAALQEASQATRMSRDQRARVDTAQAEFDGHMQTRKQAQTAAALAQWKTWDAALTEAEQAGASDTLMTALDADLRDQALLQARLQGTAESADWLALVMQAEIAAEIAGPPEEQTERMALQVDLMNQGVRSFSKADLNKLLDTWCATGPKVDMDATLPTRFFAALTKALANV